MEAQYAPVYAIAILDANHDGKTDLLLSGNNSHTRIKFGRYTANKGIFLAGDGKGGFSFVPQYVNGLKIRRCPIKHADKYKPFRLRFVWFE